MSLESKSQINDTAAPPEFLTAEEVSVRLRLPLSTVYHLAKTGALPAIQLGRTWRFPSRAIAGLSGHKPATASILVVDDDQVTRTLVADILRPRGYVLVEAGDAEAGLVAARRQRFDLLLIDFKMPGRDGTELMRELGGEYSLSQMIMITAFADLAKMDPRFEFGTLTLLRKPLDAGQIIECVERLLRNRTAENKNGSQAFIAPRINYVEAKNARRKQTLQLRKPAADA